MDTPPKAASTMFRAVVCVACVWLAAGVSAQAPTSGVAAAADSTDGPAAVGDEVIVRGRRMSDIKSDLRIEVDKFVTQVAAPASERGYARWHRRVCISIQNLERDAAQYLVDRISRLAADVGLEPGEPGCDPNVRIIFTTDGKEAARRLVVEHPGVLRPTPEGGMQAGLEAMHEFAESDKPVRWWHVSVPVDARLGNPAQRMPGQALSPSLEQQHWVTVEGPSRIHSGLRDDLLYAIIIVDGPKLQGKGTTWEQLGDYLAFVSLAQIDLTAQPSGFDSILNLFSNPKAYSGLTDWDRSYIHALYRFDQERDPRMQRNGLVDAMTITEADGK
jgi:hypothetical protein